MRAPQAENRLETVSMTMTFSAASSNSPRDCSGSPAYTNSRYASSPMMNRSCSLAMSTIMRISSGVSTVPVGLPGLVHIMARVCSLISASIFLRSA